MERFYSFVFVAGLGCFAIAFLLSMVFPWMSLKSYHGMDYQTLDDLSREPSAAFTELAQVYPESFAEAYGEVSSDSYKQALQLGRDLYVGQACWHCHSQYVRVVSNENLRWGPASNAQEFQNDLNQPHLWGTRRVGPDLGREGGRRSNDWHVAHFMNPKDVSPTSVMPSYSYYFDDQGVPDREGMALITYVQWLGSTYEPENAVEVTP